MKNFEAKLKCLLQKNEDLSEQMVAKENKLLESKRKTNEAVEVIRKIWDYKGNLGNIVNKVFFLMKVWH